MQTREYEPTPMVTRAMPLDAGGANSVVVYPGKVFKTEFDLSAWVESGYLKLVGASNAPEKAVAKSVTAEVGAMEATVSPGDDGELGTADDKTTIRPVKKAAKEAAEKPAVKRRRRKTTK